MEATVTGDDGHVTVYANEVTRVRSGRVLVLADETIAEDVGTVEFSPTRARELAVALLRAADEAEGREADGAEKDLLDFFRRTGWDGADLVAAHRQQVRNEVARDLEQMDGTNWGMSLSRTRAVRVARTGLEPMDVQRNGDHT
ncbi:hypothetical protein [Streptomyces eurythermus]